MRQLRKIFVAGLIGVSAIVSVWQTEPTDAAQAGKKRAARVFAVGQAKQKPALRANLSRAGTVANTFSREAEIVKPVADKLIEKKPAETGGKSDKKISMILSPSDPHVLPENPGYSPIYDYPVGIDVNYQTDVVVRLTK